MTCNSATPLHLRLLSALVLAFVIALPAGAASAGPYRILVLGDSLTAGYGLPENDGFIPQLQDALDKMGLATKVINGGVSGDTTAGGLSRLDWMLADRPDIILIELGANDALRGLSPEEAKNNLEQIILRCKATGARILLAGMLAPRNMGDEYAERFDAIYPALAQAHGIMLYPFFLDGVAARPELNQQDGLHPTREGVAVIVKGILPYLVDIIGTMAP